MVLESRRRRDCIALALACAALGHLPARAAGSAPAKILVVGDSLSAEYGLKRGTGWVALLTQRLSAQKVPATVINASISGDTTSGGRSRLPALLKQHRPSHVVIELGGNDALRGLPIQMSEANLRAMTEAAQAAGAKVLIVGIQLPPNYGKAYGASFAAIFEKVAEERRAALVPFFLKGVADIPEPLAMFQDDRIHPNEKAQVVMLDNVWPALKALLGGR
ncbi:arylesterase [Caldimonas brevitalea]|uniref:Arylesterase n=2 Tax=Caldimonas brevitalea TaxID=413882 RepID=A0A0G3BNM5_9BURK|nr:arylesterase [Caldimonas brevitalea]